MDRRIPSRFAVDCEKITARLLEGLGEKLFSVILYGSAARGEQNEWSDLDIYVLAQGLPESPIRRVMFLKGLLADLKTEKKVSIRGKTPEEFGKPILPLYLDLAAEGVVLYDKANFASKILEKIREKVKEVGLARYRTKEGYLGWRLNRPLEKGERIVVELEA